MKVDTKMSSGSGRKTLWICLSILALGLILTLVIFSTEPVAVREGAVKETAMLVDVLHVEAGNFRPKITCIGTVLPSKEIILSPRVAGEVISLQDRFTPGGIVQKGESLLQLDPADYQHRLVQRQSELAQAEAALKMEMGKGNVAEKEYALLEETIAPSMRSLVLREPQLKDAKAQLDAAKAAVQQAKLELARTRIIAPFDATILSRNINVGSQAAPGQELGRLAGLDTYWVEATLPVSKIRWLEFPDSPQARGTEVSIRNRNAWPAGAIRKGTLYKLLGELNDRSRLARILITVPDPLAIKETTAEDPPSLIIGSLVQVVIPAKEIKNTVRLARDYLRDNDTVWVNENGELAIRQVAVTFRDAEYAYINKGLKAGEKVVTTNLSTVVEGAPLRLKQETADGSQEQT